MQYKYCMHWVDECAFTVFLCYVNFICSCYAIKCGMYIQPNPNLILFLYVYIFMHITNTANAMRTN